MTSAEKELVGYFGFGSLVNKHTLRTSYHDLVPATLKGWRRHWQARTETLPQKVALLSIHQDPACAIKGMVVFDLAENLPLVDEREEGYTRVELHPDDLVLGEGVTLPERLYVYVANEVEQVTDNGSLLQSYLDAVMQGFFNEYGEGGVSHFVETTSQFERSIIKDRLSPLYPRPVLLTDTEAHLFDNELKRIGVKF